RARQLVVGADDHLQLRGAGGAGIDPADGPQDRPRGGIHVGICVAVVFVVDPGHADVVLPLRNVEGRTRGERVFALAADDVLAAAVDVGTQDRQPRARDGLVLSLARMPVLLPQTVDVAFLYPAGVSVAEP